MRRSTYRLFADDGECMAELAPDDALTGTISQDMTDI